MRRPCVLVFLCLAFTWIGLVLAACHSPAHVVQPGADSADPQARGLPSLGTLGQPQRRVSLTGPGYFPLEQLAILRSAHVTPGAEPKIALDATSGLAYAVYGVYGFDGDNGPTSARVTVDTASGQLFVAFSDYEHGHWIFSGPFTLPAGGGVLEAEIPNTGEYVSASAFVGSPYRATFVALLVLEGGSLGGAVVELGVHGGAQGPQPCGGISGVGGASGEMLHWQHSPSYLDPDFGGYMIERAPFLTGTYAPVNTDPATGDYLPDPTAGLGEYYRYRVAAVDTSGNRSVWMTGAGGRLPGEQQRPVADVNLPHGPLFGPVTLTLDMSGSYDPEGGAIDTYEILDVSGNELYSGAAYVLNMTFQPGCYALRFRAKVGSRYSDTLRMLKVYPQWRDSATFVASAPVQNFLPRLSFPTAARDPVSGTVWLGGYDIWAGGYVLRPVTPGPSPEPLRMPLYDAILFSGEPVMLSGSPVLPLSFERRIFTLSLAGGDLELMAWFTFSTAQANDRAALTSDGAEALWMVYASLEGTYRLNAFSLRDVNKQVVIDPLPALTALDVVYNPDLDVLEVAYSTAASTEWLRLNAATLVIVDSAPIAPLSSSTLDVECNPATQEPAVAYTSGGFVRYREHSGAGWSAEDMPDPSGNNSTAMDLDFLVGAPRILMSELAGQTSIYKPNGGGWVERDVTYTAASGLAARLLPFDDGGGDAYYVADVGSDRHVYCARLNSDGTDSMLLDRWPTCGQGLQMFGAGGNDGLHVVWRNLIGDARHVIGSADGLSWAGGGSLGTPTHLDLVALRDGAVYLSKSAGGLASLSRWDGAAFVMLSTQASAAAYRPFFAHGAPRDIVSWLAYLDGTGDFYAFQGNLADGYGNATNASIAPPVYSGTGIIQSAIANPGSSTHYLALHTGANYEDSIAGIYRGLYGNQYDICWPSTSDDLMHSPYVFGRNLASAQYATHTQLKDVYYLSNGPHEAAWRYFPGYNGDDTHVELLADVTDPMTDLRRTVSAATTPSLTAVALICDIGGREPYLEWSDFGNWEELPMPPPDMAYGSEERMSKPQLFIGHDGRWHIVYHDWDTDTIYIRSTL